MNTPEGGAEALPEGRGCLHVAGLLVVVLDGPRALKLQQRKIEMNTPEGGAEALPEGPGCFHVALGFLGCNRKNRNEYA